MEQKYLNYYFINNSKSYYEATHYSENVLYLKRTKLTSFCKILDQR